MSSIVQFSIDREHQAKLSAFTDEAGVLGKGNHPSDDLAAKAIVLIVLDDAGLSVLLSDKVARKVAADAAGGAKSTRKAEPLPL